MKRSTREYSQLPIQELEQELVNAQSELVNLRFDLATRKMSNYARLKVVRGQIARLKFFIGERGSMVVDDAV